MYFDNNHGEYRDFSAQYHLLCFKIIKFTAEAKRQKSFARPINFIVLAYFHKGNHLDAFDYFNQALYWFYNDECIFQFISKLILKLFQFHLHLSS